MASRRDSLQMSETKSQGASMILPSYQMARRPSTIAPITKWQPSMEPGELPDQVVLEVDEDAYESADSE